MRSMSSSLSYSADAAGNRSVARPARFQADFAYDQQGLGEGWPNDLNPNACGDAYSYFTYSVERTQSYNDYMPEQSTAYNQSQLHTNYGQRAPPQYSRHFDEHVGVVTDFEQMRIDEGKQKTPVSGGSTQQKTWANVASQNSAPILPQSLTRKAATDCVKLFNAPPNLRSMQRSGPLANSAVCTSSREAEWPTDLSANVEWNWRSEALTANGVRQHTEQSVTADALGDTEEMQRHIDSRNILERLRRETNQPVFIDFESSRFFVIKSFTEEDVHRSLKYSIWCSTEHGNRKLDRAYRETRNGNVYLFFSVNGSGHFCGMACMMGPVDYTTRCSVWDSRKWRGCFEVRWLFVKDVPNGALRHVRLANNDSKPITNSRDAQEVPATCARDAVRVFETFPLSTSIFDDFLYYEEVQNRAGPNSDAADPAANEPRALGLRGRTDTDYKPGAPRSSTRCGEYGSGFESRSDAARSRKPQAERDLTTLSSRHNAVDHNYFKTNGNDAPSDRSELLSPKLAARTGHNRARSRRT